MLIAPNGKAILPTDGVTGRKIIIHEAIIKGQRMWGVDFEGGGFELLEIFQIIGDVIRGIAQRERSLAAEKRALVDVKQKIHAINEQEKK